MSRHFNPELRLLNNHSYKINFMLKMSSFNNFRFSDIMTISYKEFLQTKKHLENSAGISYLVFLKSLKPSYLKVWKDICFGYISIVLCMTLSLYALREQYLPIGVTIFLGSFFVGYFSHYTLSFLHEAAHFNIHPSRKWNDRLTNLFITSWVALDIKKYRIIHFKHHSHLGTPFDSEVTYFNPLTLGFLLKCLFGIYTLKVGISYFLRSKNLSVTKRKVKKEFPLQVLLAVFFHLTVVMICWYMQGIAFAATWLIGVGLFNFFFGAVHQLLDHRSESALDDVNYSQVQHGEVARVYGDGLISSTFGSAGFNRHLLHHWEPQVSYTNLKQLEDFLCDTSLKEEIDNCRTTYFKTFYRLFRWKIKKQPPLIA
jgi:fatty acid desaturase